MIDSEGYRHNVGIIVCNDQGRLFWARRAGMDSWQFPQGGIKPNEDPECAMFRELYEETGLLSEHVQVIGRTKGWLRYDLPKRFIRRRSLPLCIGQKQLWYILHMVSTEEHVRFDCSEKPEFDQWRWVDFWHPLHEVVFFKKHVYQQALTELGAFLVMDSVPINPDGFLSKRRKGTKRFRHDAAHDGGGSPFGHPPNNQGG